MLSNNRGRPVPGTSYMSDDQMATYLKDLRTSKSRPHGSRPPPPSKFGSLRRAETDRSEETYPNNMTNPVDTRPTLLPSMSMPIMPSQTAALEKAESRLPHKSPFVGRPLIRPPLAGTPPIDNGSGSERTSSGIYLEQGSRWMEKQEAKSLRMALEDMDLAQERKIHSSAQDEAADLVWRHQNPDAPMKNPDLGDGSVEVRRDYRSHLRKGSYSRSHSREVVPRSSSRNSSGGSQRPQIAQPVETACPSLDSTRTANAPSTSSSHKLRNSASKGYGDLAAAVKKDIEIARRRTSSGNRRVLSAEKKVFMHPNDRIYEDPQEEATPPKKSMPAPIPDLRPGISPVQPSLLRKNPFARMRAQQDRLERTQSAPVLSPPSARLDRVEIQRNPPSQSRNAYYQHNESVPMVIPSPEGEEEVDRTPTPTRDGREIRGDDIRQATSKQRKDRSPNLPQPTVVSDKSNRPIVSFQKNWKPKEVVLDEVQVPGDHVGSASRSRNEYVQSSRQSSPPQTTYRPGPRSAEAPIPSIQPPIPTFNFPDEQTASLSPIPMINFPDDVPAIPTIVLPEEPDFATTAQSMPTTPAINVEPPSLQISGPGSSSRPAPSRSATVRPLPTPSSASQRPLPTPTQHTTHATSSPIPKSAPHYTPSLRQSSATCAICQHPIAGRILSAAGHRFHSSCFTCHECSTNLELVAFYPEPESAQADRHTQDPSSSELPRFYCHLDYHELFSPRCKSCKTPIENEAILACGAHWHSGHFFCAQCGDPFDASTPFVEKEGYAWCVGCHTNRFSAKCKGCRKPVTDVVVKALGAEWHAGCFVCVECKSEFTDGRYFLRGESEDPVCVNCEERRLKA